MKSKILLLCFTYFVNLSFSQLTYIPDDFFENYLESTFPNCAIGGTDNYILGEYVVGSITLNGPVQDLTGIDDLKYIHSISFTNCHFLTTINLSNVNINDTNILNYVGTNIGGMSIGVNNCPNVSNIILPQGHLTNITVGGILTSLNSVDFNSSNILTPNPWGLLSLNNEFAPNWFDIDLSMVQILFGFNVLQFQEDFRCILLDNNCYYNWESLSIVDINSANGATCVQIENPAYAQIAWPGFGGVSANYSIQCNNCTSELKSLVTKISTLPNPTSSEITITSDKFTNEPYTLYDQMGRTVGSGRLAGTSTTLSLSNLSKGIYILKVQGAYESAIVVKE